MIKCSHRIFTAVCFREIAQSSYEKTGSVILPAIGFYYAMFHMGIAMLCVEYSTPLHVLKRMGHTKLINLIENKLIDSKLISSEYLILLKNLKAIREYGNYTFGIKFKEFYDFKFIIPNLYIETGKMFDIALGFIKEICNEVEKQYNIQFRFIAMDIGDGIGDDLYTIYLKEADEERVVKYLSSKNLTT